MFLLAEGGHHTPLIVEFVNHYLGGPVHELQMAYTYKFWTAVFGNFGTTPEAMFGPYTPEKAIPWYTIMFLIACLLDGFDHLDIQGQTFRGRSDKRPVDARSRISRYQGHDCRKRHRRPRFQVFSDRSDICVSDAGIQLDGAVPAVHVADGFGERHIRARHIVVCLLQLCRH